MLAKHRIKRINFLKSVPVADINNVSLSLSLNNVENERILETSLARSIFQINVSSDYDQRNNRRILLHVERDRIRTVQNIYIYIRSNRVIEAKLERNLYTETFIEGTVGRIETPKLWLLKRAASLGTRLKSATVLQYVRTTFTCISFSRVAETLVACI